MRSRPVPSRPVPLLRWGRAVGRAWGRLLSAAGRRLRRAFPTADALGRRGEREAVRRLRAEGYRVLARRLRTTGGEVDVVALDGETLVLVEVKATASGRTARDRVDARKRRRLAAARAALARDPRLRDRPWRLDVVEVSVRDGRATSRLLRGAATLRHVRGARKACAGAGKGHNRPPADGSPR